MNDSNQTRISKLYQILSGKISNKRMNYPLFEWDTLIDFFLAFYDHFCDPSMNHKDKAIGMFNKLYGENVKELKDLRTSKSDFEFVKTIGKGHFGEVIVVKEKNTSNVYAMKVLKKGATLSQDNMAFYFEERDIMAFANSEWVTTLHYAFQDYDSLYLVMEFLPGGDLLSLLNRYDDCMVDEVTCRFYLSEIIIATNCVHKIGYVHRDIKPENVLLDLTGHIKLADFGSAAKLVNGKQVFGKMPVGTPEYIAPEVLTSMDSGGGKYGTACDYWSIGVVAYEMLFGMLPFEADSVLQLYNQIMNFGKTLEFPDDIELSVETENLIRGLICDQNNRFTYSTLAQHEFFKSMDWTTIKNMPPPYVPVVTSRTDTSNFDDINTSSSVVNKGATTTSKVFSTANNLPFVGFNFTRSLQQQLVDDSNKVGGNVNRKVSITGNNYGDDTTLMSNNVTQLDKSTTDIMLLEYKSLVSDLESSKKELEKVKKDFSSSQTEITQIEIDKNYYIGEVDKLKTRYKELSNKYEQTIQHNSQIDSQGTKLVSELLSIFDDCVDSNSTDQSNLIENIKTRYKTLKEDKEIAMKQVENLTAEISSLNYQMELLSSHMKMNDERYNTTCVELKETISSLQALLEKSDKESRETISQLKQAALDDENKIRKLMDDVETPSSLNRKTQDPKLLGVLQSDLNTANTSVTLLTDENAKLSEKLFEADENAKRYKSQVVKLEHLLETITNDLKCTEVDSIKLKKTISDKNLAISNLNENISALERAKVEVMCQLDIVKSKLRSMEIEKMELEIKVNELKCTADKSKNKDHDDVQLLSSDLRSANNRILSLSEELEDRHSSELFIMNSLKNARNEISDLTTTVNKLESINSSTEVEVKLLKETVQAQKMSNYSLTELIEKLKDDLFASTTESRRISNEFEEFKVIKCEEEFRLTETLKQQEKLIEFLQSMNAAKKKPYKSEARDDHQSFIDTTTKSRKEKISRMNRAKSTKSKDKSHEFDKERDSLIRMHNIALNSTIKESNSLNSPSLQSEHQSNVIKHSTFISDSMVESSAAISSSPCKTENLVTSTFNSQSEPITVTSPSMKQESFQSVEDNVISEEYHIQPAVVTPLSNGLEKTNNINDSSSFSRSQLATMPHGSEEIIDNPSKHQLVERLNLFKNVCMVCYNIIKFGVTFSVCKNCNLKCHTDCGDLIFLKCGLTSYDWFSYIPTIKFCSDNFTNEKRYKVPVMGWVNTLTKVIKTKTEWEQRWMVVTNNMLKFFKTPKTIDQLTDDIDDKSDLIECYKFSPAEFTVHINMRTSDTLTYAGTTDSKSYWSIEVPSKYNTISRKKKSISASLFFSSSCEDKIYWIAMLGNIFHQYSTVSKRMQTSAHYIHCIEEVDTAHQSHINFSIMLNNDVSLVATTDELYIYNNNIINKGTHFMKLQGFNFISGMTKVKDNIFMICGKSRLLLKVDSKIIMSELKAKVPTVYDTTKFIFSGLYKQCHLMCAGKCQGEKYICIAIGDRFVIFKPSNSTPILDITFDSFIKNIHFTSLGVLYKTDIIRIFNVKSGDSKNFLDQNDSSLAVQIFGQKSSYNYLIDVITFKSKKYNEEFLLCYSELGIFVNKDGTRSRMIDLVWVGVPTEFHLVQKNLLCVCYFDRIDTYDLSESTLSSSEINVKISYPAISPTIIHKTSNCIIVCASDSNGFFGIYKINLS